MAGSNRTLRVTKDEWTFFGTLLPYLAMILGALLTLGLGVLTRVGIMLQHNYANADINDASKAITWVAAVSCLVLGSIAWKLFSQRKGHFIAPHATVTVILAHLWLILAVWEDSGDWMFGAPTLYAYFYGSIIVGLSWCIRRWAVREEGNGSDESENPFEAAGLGAARVDKRNSREVPGGHRFRLKLPIGKTIEDAKSKRTTIAQIAGKPRTLVHVSETSTGVEGEVDVIVLTEDPFKTEFWWQGPDFPGDSIVSPISYATYDTGERPHLYLAGKNGASSQHFLTMGMSGAGKSKAWQVIYGSALNRKEVSVIFGDPAKGMQTGGPLASGLEWFATTEADCMLQIAAIMRAIPARTDYLTARGLDHWQRGCGLNFVIFHLEEAARFAEVDELVEMIEAARSAGICIVISLQKATHDRLKTSARYNLGGNMCFGVKMKSDAKFGLSEYAIESGAMPHIWQDKKPGYHYLEAHGLDSSMAGHPLRTDWLDLKRLEAEVDNGSDIRTPLDSTTADAFGLPYAQYRTKVVEGTTNWQELRRNRGFEVDTKDWQVGTPEKLTVEQLSLIEDIPAEDSATARFGFNTPLEETEAYRQHLRDIILAFKQSGKETFTPADIWNAGFTGRSKGWVSQNLTKLVKDGLISYDKDTKFYRVV
jgi:hypothetical protein